jgi:signal transduction histidine kinase
MASRLALGNALLVMASTVAVAGLLYLTGGGTDPGAALGVALIIVFGLLAAVYLAGTAARPIENLAHAADEVIRGNLDVPVPAASADEIGRLGTAFRTLVGNVARSRAEFEVYRQGLEDKVRARTERLEALNRELQEANRLKSEFLATVSHELRTPLHVILGYCEMLADGVAGPLNDEQQQLLDAIQRYSRVQFDLVTNVLDFSRLTSGKVSLHVERFAMEAVLADVQKLFARLLPEGVQLNLRVAPNVPPLETDRVKLQEIVRNLVDNAVKFTSQGTISVRAEAEPTAGWMSIEVQDTGPGIPPEELPHIFEAFRQVGEANTRSTAGVGLGLSIVKQLVEVLGGTASVSSRLGEGALFRVELPCRLNVGHQQPVA